MDVATDARLQPLIREVFKGMTLLTIAHRLNTVITMDRILVLSAGEVVEYDSPAALLEQREGSLSAMVDAMGESAAKQLRDAAAQAAAIPSDAAASAEGEEEGYLEASSKGIRP